MTAGMVIGSVWATRKDQGLSGQKLLVVQPLNLQTGDRQGIPLVAVDTIGAGVGERVLLVVGGAAGRAVGTPNRPVDVAVVGIIDGAEIVKEV